LFPKFGADGEFWGPWGLMTGGSSKMDFLANHGLLVFGAFWQSENFRGPAWGVGVAKVGPMIQLSLPLVLVRFTELGALVAPVWFAPGFKLVREGVGA